MPTYYVEDFDGERSEDAVEPVDFHSKVVDSESTENKVVGSSENKNKRPKR